MGSTLGRGMGGAGPPSEEQDKQLISNSGGVETPMGQPRRQGEESSHGAAKKSGRRVRRNIKDPSCTEYVML
jgi:general stress protein YciG